MQLANSKSFVRPYVLIQYGDSAAMLRSVRNSILSRCGANMVGQSRHHKEDAKVAMMDMSRLFFAVNALNFEKGGDLFFRPWRIVSQRPYVDRRSTSIRKRKLTYADLFKDID